MSRTPCRPIGPVVFVAACLALWAVPATAQGVAQPLVPGGKGTSIAGQQRLPSDPYGFELLVSGNADRSDPEPLEGQVYSGPIYVFLNAGLGNDKVPALEIDRVRFAMDDRQFNTILQVEGAPPYDLAGTGAQGQANPLDTKNLPDGPHIVSAQVIFRDGSMITTSGGFQSVDGDPIEPLEYGLVMSQSAERLAPVPLDGQTVVGDVFVFLQPEEQVASAAFYVDDPTQSGPAFHTEGTAPFDLVGSDGSGDALPFDTLGLSDGLHEISAVVETTPGPTVVVSSTFTVGNTLPRLTFDTSPLVLAVNPGDLVATGATLDTSDALPADFVLGEETGWLQVSPVMGTTPQSLFVDVDSTSLPPGPYVGTVTATAPGYVPGTLNVVLDVADVGGCVPLACDLILVDLPYALDFASDHDMIRDKNGVGTGFTHLDPTTNGAGLLPELLEVDPLEGTLRITTTHGIQFKAFNSQDNALGVGIDAPSQVSILRTTLVDVPAGTGSYEQAGLWFGVDEDNYVKHVVMSSPAGTYVQLAMEVGGQTVGEYFSDTFDPTAADVHLALFVDPFDETIRAEYALEDASAIPVDTVSPPPEFFSFDAAGINPAIGTRSFGGIFATHRTGPAPLVYTFDGFSVEEGPSISASGDLDFEKTSIAMTKPTAMTWAPDGRLYAVNVTGQVHAFTLDGDNAVVHEEVITSLTDDLGANRLALGITVDPFATAGDVILYVAHSNVNQGNGQINSGMVSRLSGRDFTTVEHVVTGLPRAIANHSLNHLHFGPDNRLYIAVGGNTGAGAANVAPTEFGNRPEQPLSAAIVVADLLTREFDGSCANEMDYLGPPPCSVTTWATGLRNLYDFVFHSNGHVYGPDNGLGVTGTFPPSPSPPCTGLGDPDLVAEGGDNPGPQPDPLLLIEEGMYYGHPNPSRDECIFGDGSLQGVPPAFNYRAPIYDLGDHRSANGIVEYPFDVGCVQLAGDLLIANYSTGDDLTRVKLAPDGLSVLDAASFVGGFDDPLALAVSPWGDIYVAEFGGDEITALRPRSLGCWSDAVAPVPAQILDAASAVVADRLYMVGGKTSSAHVSSVRVYDPLLDAWSTAPDVPGPQREDMAVVSHGDRLYVFGGSTAPFSGAIPDAYVFDPGTQMWSALAPMGQERGGATAQALGGVIVVAGGMDVDGDSLSGAEAYDVALDTWTPVASMGTRRDNAVSAAADGLMYVFGGRTRNADGTTIDATLASVESYDPLADTWTPRAFMPTGRRRMIVGLLDGRVQVMGGEATPTSGAFAENEEYDPASDTWRTLQKMATPRQGAAYGTIGDFVYVAGGGIVAGAGWTDLVERFGF